MITSRFVMGALSVSLLAVAAQAAPGQYDGAYTSATLPTGTAQCTAPGKPFVLRVTGNTASMKFFSYQPIEGQVAPDGSIAITTPRTSLMGKIANAAFEGYLGFGNCQFHLQLPKQ